MNQAQLNAIASGVGYLTPFLIVFVVGLFFSIRLGKKRDPQRLEWWPLVIAVSLIALTVLVPITQHKQSLGAGAEPLHVTVQMREYDVPPGTTMRRRDPAEQEVLKSRFVESARTELTKSNDSVEGIQAVISYLGSGSEMLETASVTTSEGTVVALVIAFKAGKQYEIACIPDKGLRKTFKLSTGECGAKIKEVLGAPYAKLVGP